MLWWRKELWLIDHGAGLYFHHSWNNWEEEALKPFTHIKDHVLLSQASELEKVDTEFHSLLDDEMIRSIVALIPEAWLLIDSPFKTVAHHRDAYTQFLTKRFAHSEIIVKAAQHAREVLI
jgi:hypothetical protein